jgi:hypothetical protein
LASTEITVCSTGQWALTDCTATRVLASHKASTVSLSYSRNCSASGPKSCDSGMATAPICSTAM